jgi:hypothetical protein
MKILNDTKSNFRGTKITNVPIDAHGTIRRIATAHNHTIIQNRDVFYINTKKGKMENKFIELMKTKLKEVFPEFEKIKVEACPDDEFQNLNKKKSSLARLAEIKKLKI